MIGSFSANSITIRHLNGKWGGELTYIDNGARSNDTDARRVCTEGVLRTRYLSPDGEVLDALTVVIDALIRDAAVLDIELVDPTLFIDEGEHFEVPENWGALARAQCERLGWTPLPSQA